MRAALLCLFFAVFMAVTSSHVNGQSLFEIRPVVDSLQPGAYNTIVEGAPQGVFLGRNVFFTLADIDSASVYTGTTEEGTPMYAVNIAFKQALNDSMRSLTEHRIGQRFAIIVDGKVLATPRILDPLKTARISLSAPTEAEARELAKKIEGALKKR
jgi:preprotein translocase subunit SecD